MTSPPDRLAIEGALYERGSDDEWIVYIGDDGYVMNVSHQESRLLDKIEELRAALEPFAVMGRLSSDDRPDADLVQTFSKGGSVVAELRLGDFRRAAAAHRGRP